MNFEYKRTASEKQILSLLAENMPESNYFFWLYNYILDYDRFFENIITDDLKTIFADDYNDDMKELYEVLHIEPSGGLRRYFDFEDPKGFTTSVISYVLLPLLNYKKVYRENKVIGLSSFGGDFTNCYIPISSDKNFYVYFVLTKLLFMKYLDKSNNIVKQINNISYIHKLLSSRSGKNQAESILTPSILYRLLNLNYSHDPNTEPSSFDSLAECDLYEYRLFHVLDFIVKDLMSVENILQIQSQVTSIKNKYLDRKTRETTERDECSICHNLAVNQLANGDCNFCYFNKYR